MAEIITTLQLYVFSVLQQMSSFSEMSSLWSTFQMIVLTFCHQRVMIDSYSNLSLMKEGKDKLLMSMISSKYKLLRDVTCNVTMEKLAINNQLHYQIMFQSKIKGTHSI